MLLSADTDAAAFGSLLYLLGGQQFAVPIPGPVAGTHQLGELAGLPFWMLEGAPRAPLPLIRRLARRALPGVVAGRVAHQAWILAVTLQPLRVTSVPAGAIDALPLRRLQRAARQQASTPLERAVQLAEALDTDAAGRRTFGMLHRLLDAGVAALPAEIGREERHAWILIQLIRLLFLRFVESEGWLNGDPRFLSHALDRCLAARRDPMRDFLRPLFFGTLNRGATDRGKLAGAFGTIPYLNGGLFEVHAIERRHRFHLPRDFWIDVFAALVERVDLTLDEAALDGRVTPELLGRVFEGAMHPEERRAQGTYYTPPELVRGLLCDALAAHLAVRRRAPEHAIRRMLDDPDARTRADLLDVSVLDPAVGSGAFLVEALHLLHGPGPRDPRRVRTITTRQLFGVDINPGAVRITELRLWLELLRSLRGTGASSLPPLPNLDASIRAGDTLIDPLRAGHPGHMRAQALHKCQRALATARGRDKRRAVAEWRRTERTTVIEAIEHSILGLDDRIGALLDQARNTTLFGEVTGLDRSARKQLIAWRRERRHLRQERRRLVRDASSPAFAIAAAFAPVVVARGGFDLVVGNPPWVRAERLPSATRAALADRYRWWRGSAHHGWRHLPDLSIAFVERSWNLLAPQGTMALLLPAKVATASYATTCRRALARDATIHHVADLASDPRAGFEATTYPMALIASHLPPQGGHEVSLALDDGDRISQCAWIDQDTWTIRLPEIQAIATRLRALHPTFDATLRLQLGVKTGANAVFVDPPESLQPWTRPAIRARDVRPFLAPARHTLLWTADNNGSPWRALPRQVAEYLREMRHQLDRRADQHRGPWWQLFRTRAAVAPHRVIWRDMAPALHAAALNETTAVALNSCYTTSVRTASAALALSAWLNSEPIRLLAQAAAEPAAGGFFRFGARAVGSIPLPPAVLDDSALASHGGLDEGSRCTSDLSAVVHRLLGSTDQERAVIDAMAADCRARIA